MSDLVPQDDCTGPQRRCLDVAGGGRPEISIAFVTALETYNCLVGVLLLSDIDVPEVRRGEQLFTQLHCDACRRPTLTTGGHELAALAGQTLHPFTDLLLHDMDPGLADGQPDFAADGREWRTASLWGLGLIVRVNWHSRLMHGTGAHGGRGGSLARRGSGHRAFEVLSAPKRAAEFSQFFVTAFHVRTERPRATRAFEIGQRYTIVILTIIRHNMKSADRLRAVDSSSPGWRAGVPGLPLQDATLMRLVRVASLGITACVDPLLRPDGLTESSFHTLIIVMASGVEGISPGVLCDQVGQTRANMTRILFVIESVKLVAISTDGRDGRRRRVCITPSGRRLVQKCSARLAPSIVAAMSGLPDADKQTFDRLLRALIASMDLAERTMSMKA